MAFSKWPPSQIHCPPLFHMKVVKKRTTFNLRKHIYSTCLLLPDACYGCKNIRCSIFAFQRNPKRFLNETNSIVVSGAFLIQIKWSWPVNFVEPTVSFSCPQPFFSIPLWQTAKFDEKNVSALLEGLHTRKYWAFFFSISKCQQRHKNQIQLTTFAGNGINVCSDIKAN